MTLLPAALAPTFGGPAPYEQLPPVDAHFQSRARREGELFDEVALDHLMAAGAAVDLGRHKIEHYPVDARIVTPNGGRYLVAAHGNFDEGSQPGLQRTDTVAKVFQRAVMLHAKGALPLIVVTSHMPKPGSATSHHLADLHALLGPWLVDVVAVTGDFAGFHRLQRLFTDVPRSNPSPASWWHADPQLRLFDLGGRHA
jgi:hypothetical protein